MPPIFEQTTARRLYEQTANRRVTRSSSAATTGTVFSAMELTKCTSLQDYFFKAPCPYTHEVFLLAGKIFDALRHPSNEDNPYLRKRQEELAKKKQLQIPELDFPDEKTKRLTFELAFSSLQYQLLLEDVLNDTAFFSQFPEFKEDDGVTLVIFYDFQKRMFQHRTPHPGEQLDSHLLEIEAALQACKTKLSAAMARNRIKNNVLSVECLLPSAVRQKSQVASSLPVFAWVNQLKTSISAVIDQFKEEGFQYRNYDGDERLMGKAFWVDLHCNDLLTFPAEYRHYLNTHSLVENGHLVVQDKSSCLGPHSVKPLINDGDDIIHVNIASGLTTGHIASLSGELAGIIWGFGIKSENHYNEVQKKIEELGTKNVKIMQENFMDIQPDDSRFKHVKAILVTTECSKSGIVNPVDFIVNEGEDMTILKDLSLGEVDNSKLGELIAKHGATLKHALKFSKVQAVVYTTRSVHSSENENVVMKAIDNVNMLQQRRTGYRVMPPVLPLGEKDLESTRSSPRFRIPSDKYLKFEQTEQMSGCFTAVISREPEDPKEAAKDILARAKMMGLLSGGSEQQAEDTGDESGERPIKKKRSPRRSKSTPHRPPAEKPSVAVTNTRTTQSVYSSKGLRNSPKKKQKKVVAFGSTSLSMSKKNHELLSNLKEKKPTPSHIVQHPNPFSEPMSS